MQHLAEGIDEGNPVAKKRPWYQPSSFDKLEQCLDLSMRPSEYERCGMASTISKHTPARPMLTCQTVKSLKELIDVHASVRRKAYTALKLQGFVISNWGSVEKLLCDRVPKIARIATREARHS